VKREAEENWGKERLRAFVGGTHLVTLRAGGRIRKHDQVVDYRHVIHS
jgi:hypothetical protein